MPAARTTFRHLATWVRMNHAKLGVALAASLLRSGSFFSSRRASTRFTRCVQAHDIVAWHPGGATSPLIVTESTLGSPTSAT